MTKHERHIRKIIRDADCRALSWTQNKHIAVELETSFAARFRFIFPVSPSCGRWARNQETLLAQMIAKLKQE